MVLYVPVRSSYAVLDIGLLLDRANVALCAADAKCAASRERRQGEGGARQDGVLRERRRGIGGIRVAAGSQKESIEFAGEQPSKRQSCALFLIPSFDRLECAVYMLCCND
eukprot:CAMPEP_0177757648 /NCGR_PEP_ID=MMETSP0491_2-20121128/3755_1 /TAXON_ID=63592 /ORGANISM="Tetraselmis chuii, Strain PLY429" /LENGTH=109 /DNA_ID=CAMNT_0019273313 /DNA_START=485 /DNA_END=814 /DNA_ORIENTATION=+